MNKRMATIQENREIAKDIFFMQFKMHEEGIAKQVEVGQFVHIAIPNNKALILRRPISINNVDRENNTIDIIYQIAGEGTRIFAEQPEGAEIDVLGPLGKGFKTKDAKQTAFILGGGVGVAPLYLLAKELKEQGVRVDGFMGFRSKEFIYQQSEFEAVCDSFTVATEDGSAGHKGFVTTVLEDKLKEAKPDVIYVCGPTPMLKVAQKIAMGNDISCQLSLEEHMGCGIGSCLVCVCKIRAKSGDTYKHVCKDGPVFKASEVVFDV